MLEMPREGGGGVAKEGIASKGNWNFLCPCRSLGNDSSYSGKGRCEDLGSGQDVFRGHTLGCWTRYLEACEQSAACVDLASAEASRPPLVC